MVEIMKVMRACVAASNGRIAHSSSDDILAEGRRSATYHMGQLWAEAL